MVIQRHIQGDDITLVASTAGDHERVRCHALQAADLLGEWYERPSGGETNSFTVPLKRSFFLSNEGIKHRFRDLPCTEVGLKLGGYIV